jgi:L-ribulose-5-phosphate 3-epimerase
MNRREFVFTSAAAAVPVTAAAPRPQIVIFSKHLPKLDWAQVGAKAKDLGFEGVDLTVRPKGHVLPENVATDLPKAVDAIRKAGMSVPMITTDLKSADDPAARPTFEAMKKAGITLYKPGYIRYEKDKPVLEIAAKGTKDYRGLIALGQEYGAVAGLHNHSNDDFGEAVWDYKAVLDPIPASVAGYYFDPAHAAVEGAYYGWRVSLGLVTEPPGRLKMVAIKDFQWVQKNGRWQPEWCPLGKGVVDWPVVMKAIAASGFSGPMTLHSEYPGGEEYDAIARDLAFLKQAIR